MKLVPLPHRFISFAGHLSPSTKRQALLAQMSVVKVGLGSKQSLAPDLSGLSRESHLSIRAVSAQLMKSGAAEQCNEPMRCGFNVPDELYACPLCRTIPRISKSTSKTYFGLGDWAAGAPLRSQSFAVTMIGQGLGTVEVFP
jgi:hypothetical protein